MSPDSWAKIAAEFQPLVKALAVGSLAAAVLGHASLDFPFLMLGI